MNVSPRAANLRLGGQLHSPAEALRQILRLFNENPLNKLDVLRPNRQLQFIVHEENQRPLLIPALWPKLAFNTQAALYQPPLA